MNSKAEAGAAPLVPALALGKCSLGCRREELGWSPAPQGESKRHFSVTQLIALMLVWHLGDVKSEVRARLCCC